MVTQVEQISEAELELERQRKRIAEYESQAQTISKEQIPQRRFGSGVTKEQQKNILQRKKSASDYIESLKPVKQQLTEQQSQVSSNKQALQRYEEEKAAYERAESYAARGDANSVQAAYFNLKRKGYSKAYDYFLDLYGYYKGQKKSKPQYNDTGVSTEIKITPLKDPTGKVIGYDDPFAGQSRLQTPTEKLTGRPQKPVPIINKYQPLVYEYPKSKLNEIKQIQFTQASNLGYKITGYNNDGKEIRKIPLFSRQYAKAPSVSEFGAGVLKSVKFGVGGTYNLALNIEEDLSKSKIQYKGMNKYLPKYENGKPLSLPKETSYGAITKEDIQRSIKNPEYAGGFIAGNLLSFKLPKIYIKYFNTPVQLGKVKGFRETVQAGENVFIIEREKDFYKATQVIKPITIEEKAFSVGKFKLTSITPPTYQEYYPSVASSKIFSPSRKVISKARTDVTKSTPIIVSESGEIVNRPATFTNKKGARLTYVSELKGKQEQLTPELFNNLPLQTQKNLQSLTERRIGMPVSLKNTPYLLKKDELYSFGEIVSTKTLRVSPRTNTAFIYPKGKRTSIGAVTSDVKEVLGTPEYSVFKGETIVKDISLPKLGKAILKEDKIPKLSTNTKGAIFIEETSVVLKPTNLDDAGSSIVTGLVQQKKVTPKQIETLSKTISVSAKELSSRKIYPKIPSAPIQKPIFDSKFKQTLTANRVAQSEYYGKGTYEKTEATSSLMPIKELSMISNIKPQAIMNKYNQVNVVKPSSKYRVNQIQPLAQKSGLDILSLNKQLNEVKQVESLKQVQQQKQVQSTALKQTQVQKQFSNLSRTPSLNAPRIRSPKPSTFRLPNLKLDFGKAGGNSFTKAYRTFVKQGGKVKFLSGYREKGEALRFGEDVATKTLRATFGVQATQQKIQAKQTQYTPSKIFRGFKIEKGKKVRIEDTFIQKKGTRLSNRGEVSEILSAKRRT